MLSKRRSVRLNLRVNTVGLIISNGVKKQSTHKKMFQGMNNSY